VNAVKVFGRTFSLRKTCYDEYRPLIILKAGGVMKKKKKERKMTIHHVPPRSRGKTQFLLEKPEHEHRAYHLLFGNAASYEECCQILWKDWWKPSSEAVRRQSQEQDWYIYLN